MKGMSYQRLCDMQKVKDTIEKSTHKNWIVYGKSKS